MLRVRWSCPCALCGVVAAFSVTVGMGAAFVGVEACISYLKSIGNGDMKAAFHAIEVHEVCPWCLTLHAMASNPLNSTVLCLRACLLSDALNVSFLLFHLKIAEKLQLSQKSRLILKRNPSLLCWNK